jgi:hypothetical protein
VPKRSIRTTTALGASFTLLVALVVPLHTHTCPWPSAASGSVAFESLANEGGPRPAGCKGICLACALGRRLQARVTVVPVVLHALPAVTAVVLMALAAPPARDRTRQAPPRGPPFPS